MVVLGYIIQALILLYISSIITLLENIIHNEQGITLTEVFLQEEWNWGGSGDYYWRLFWQSFSPLHYYLQIYWPHHLMS